METELPWHIVEQAIKDETQWLEKVIVQHTTEKALGSVHASDRHAEETHHKYHPLARADQ